jgi:hypothetical protein
LRLTPPKSAIGGRIDGKVRLGGKIKHKGELNKISEREYGRTYFDLPDDQRHRVLRILKYSHGKTEKQLLGSMQAQIVFRKNQPDHVTAKAENDRKYISEQLYR